MSGSKLQLWFSAIAAFSAFAAGASLALAQASQRPPASMGVRSDQQTTAGATLNLAQPTIGSVIGQARISVTRKQENLELRHVVANVNGQQVESDIMRLTGPEAIENAFRQGLLPESARDALLEHARNLDEGEPPIYIVNKQIAEQWAKTHTPLPKATPTQQPPRGAMHDRATHLVYASYRPDPDPQSLKHAEHELSKDAKHAEKEAEHAGGQISDAYKQATGQSNKWWKHWQSEATKDFEKFDECWVDHRLSVRRHVSPSIQNLGYTVDLGSLKLGQGTVRFDLPVSVDMDAEASVFYIPCMAVFTGNVPLPFFIRPRDVSVQNGHLSATANIAANVQQIAFNGSKDFFAPPAIQLIPNAPIWAGPVPIFIEAYLYLRGGITYNGSGQIEANFTASTKKEGPFSFTCNGHGCQHDFTKLTAQSEILQNPSLRPHIAARATIEPYFWAAVQVGVDEGLLMGRAGPEIAISGDVWAYEGAGCGAAAGTNSPSDSVKALTADIDANIYATWQVGTMGITDPTTGDYFPGAKGVVPNGHETARKRDVLFSKHLYFGDLVGSTALSPLVAANGIAAVAQPASYSFRMRPCYPYHDDIQYRLQWSALNATAPGAAQPTAVSVWSAPQKDFIVNHAWMSPGDYTVSVTPVGDRHNRAFTAHTTNLIVHIDAQGKARAQAARPQLKTAAAHK